MLTDACNLMRVRGLVLDVTQRLLLMVIVMLLLEYPLYQFCRSS